jgi:DNA-binding beta-propeller fold protein YncE
MPKNALIIFFLLMLTTPADAFTISNFENPYCVRVDPDDGAYYVSNVRNRSGDKGENGYISKISASGNIVFQKFIGGRENNQLFRAPKGLMILGRRLLVADTDTVKIFDKKKSKLMQVIDLSKSGAKSLSSLTADSSGFLYVSDTQANAIYTHRNFQVEIFKSGSVLGHPTGLLVNPRSKNLMVLAFQTGQLLEIDRMGRIHVLRRGLSTPQGLDYDNAGDLYISSSEKGEIYKIGLLGRGVLSTFLSGLTAPADISYDRKKEEILIPSFKRSTVTTVYKHKPLR